MDRRKSIKTLLIGTAAGGALLTACETLNKKPLPPATPEKALAASELDRMEEEKVFNKKVGDMKFFTDAEMAMITILANIIIPKDNVSGSASDAKVPEFIAFIVNDMPEHQIPMRGGLRWIDVQSLNRFSKPFVAISESQRLKIIDDIAYPEKVKPGMEQGVAFFNRMRNLTATGFFTSEMGVKDIDYRGNVPNQWNGVPPDVLKQYNLAYSEKELRECISFSKDV